MTSAQVDAAIEALTPKRVGLPSVPSVSGLTRTSLRRLIASRSL
jgi:hypothetical protein